MNLILTPARPLTLLDQSIARTGFLLRDGCYKQYACGNSSDSNNPFARLPSRVADALFRVVVLAEENTRTTKADMLCPLLAGGRVTNLDFSFSGLGLWDFIHVFCAIPEKSKVQRLSVIPQLTNRSFFRDILFTFVVKNFVSKCTDLEYLGIPGEAFCVQVIPQHRKLKNLFVGCVWHPMLQTSQIGDSFLHQNLTEISICTGQDLHAVTARMLECCPNLVKVHSDIAGALEILHGREYHDGSLRKRYNLQKYHLEFQTPNKSLSIASAVCPMTSELHLMYWNDNLYTYADMDGLASLKNIESLTVGSEYDTVSLEVHSVLGVALKHIGAGIKCLSLSYVRVDFEVIGSCCPNLTELDVTYALSREIVNPSEKYFVNLKELSLDCDADWPYMKREELKFLLRSCKDLETLRLCKAQSLTDRLMDTLLRKNSLRCLKTARLSDCSLTREGILQLLRNCRRLESIDISSVLIPTNEAVAQIVKSFNAHARPASWDGPVLELLNSFFAAENNVPRRRENSNIWEAILLLLATLVAWRWWWCRQPTNVLLD